MAMRLYTKEEFEGELLRRRCEKIADESAGGGTYWRHPDGRVFQAPVPEEPDGRIPDSILDHLILAHRLPDPDDPI